MSADYEMPPQSVLAEATDEDPLFWVVPNASANGAATKLYSVHEAVSGKMRILACDCYLEDAKRIVDALRGMT